MTLAEDLIDTLLETKSSDAVDILSGNIVFKKLKVKYDLDKDDQGFWFVTFTGSKAKSAADTFWDLAKDSGKFRGLGKPEKIGSAEYDVELGR